MKRVIALSKNLENLKEMKEKLGKDKIEIISVDLSDEKETKKAAETSLKYGPIDFVVNNAGVASNVKKINKTKKKK